MSREGYTTISAWDRTMPLIKAHQRRLARDRGLPVGKTVSIADTLHNLAASTPPARAPRVSERGRG